jgi:hypothetical protein
LHFQTDFERAAIKAINHVFPNASVHGCLFHYTQCIWRRVQEVGLAKQYNQRNPRVVEKVVRRLKGLPLLKPEDVFKGYNSAIQLVRQVENHNIRTKLHDLLN